MVNGDVRECSVMLLSVTLAFDGRCVEVLLPFSKSLASHLISCHLALLLRLRVVLRQFVDVFSCFSAAVCKIC